ncbi:OmpA family protein [Wenyingzhuangia sp. 2_MG-2023]|uniref:OmpA family protein n=1 Tax=Wenyingzhuangia sp. 2_MG-2023 TaxID=3062639 RepID=UPI0026E184C4|nr:OmpA family protein [Wenyingzhuangia sp. 2_MG-2023]MDO6736725.1 OmpA family protein [Wenyingzhuangia sp. 2_MG-2023]
MKAVLVSIVTLFMFTSCVTKKRFVELSDKYDKLYKTNGKLIAKNDQLLKDKNTIGEQLSELQQEKKEVDNQVASLEQSFKALQKKQENLQDSYDLLSSKSSSEINAKASENQKLLIALEDKENELFEEEAELRKLKAALDARSKRIEDLEALIASKEQAMEKLKDAISDALIGFEGKGLTVVQRDGKIYVSMDNKLLFGSGQWAVGANGKKAVIELAKVLVENPDINVLIEGHTDNVPYKSGGVIQDNWDLSVKRATAIVRILQNEKVSANQITAAGRSEYNPVATNETVEGKAKNRRIEIVLSPNLDAITKLLNE